MFVAQIISDRNERMCKKKNVSAKEKKLKREIILRYSGRAHCFHRSPAWKCEQRWLSGTGEKLRRTDRVQAILRVRLGLRMTMLHLQDFAHVWEVLLG